jgi:hypothetical protein
MSKNPLINALLASTYIGVIVAILTNAERFAPEVDSPLAPMAFISLLVLSVSVMGYLFFYQPALLFFDNKREEAVNFFLKTVVVFAVLTLGFLAAAFFVR